MPNILFSNKCIVLKRVWLLWPDIDTGATIIEVELCPRRSTQKYAHARVLSGGCNLDGDIFGTGNPLLKHLREFV